MLRPLLPASIDLDIVLPETTVCVDADSRQVQQVLVNLALNARDAMEAGGRLTITLRTEILNESSGQSIIEVRDTGAGMDADLQDHLFEPFFTTKRRGHGCGLGLAMARQIIAEYDGEIHVESVVGHGTTFSVTLPCLLEAAVASWA